MKMDTKYFGMTKEDIDDLKFGRWVNGFGCGFLAAFTMFMMIMCFGGAN